MKPVYVFLTDMSLGRRRGCITSNCISTHKYVHTHTHTRTHSIPDAQSPVTVRDFTVRTSAVITMRYGQKMFWEMGCTGGDKVCFPIILRNVRVCMCVCRCHWGMRAAYTQIWKKETEERDKVIGNQAEKDIIQCHLSAHLLLHLIFLTVHPFSPSILTTNFCNCIFMAHPFFFCHYCQVSGWHASALRSLDFHRNSPSHTHTHAL